MSIEEKHCPRKDKHPSHLHGPDISRRFPYYCDGTAEKADIHDLIERGSLGTPEAKAIRATVSDEEVARVLALAEELEKEEQQ